VERGGFEDFQGARRLRLDQFDGYVVDGDLHENGKLVLGEKYRRPGRTRHRLCRLRKIPCGKPRPSDKDGFTPEQRLFLGWAQVWGANQRIEYARLMANTNPHPLSKFRANGPLSNMAEFAKAFGCKKGNRWCANKPAKSGSRAQPELPNLEEPSRVLGNYSRTRVLEVENDPAASWKLFCPCLKKAVRT